MGLPVAGAGTWKAPASVTLASAANITQCLGVQGRQVATVDCLEGEGVAWLGTPASLRDSRKLRLVGVESQGAEMEVESLQSSPAECLRATTGGFLLWPCEQTETTWRWDPATLQLTSEGSCLGVEAGHLALAACRQPDGGGRGAAEEQKAAADQTWVLLPTDRPQVEMLDSIVLPLRTSGRYVGDSDGRRVKLAGVNWLEAAEVGAQNLTKVVQIIKYLGFNAVRVPFSNSTALKGLDAAVEAITSEKLLVLLSRHDDELYADGEQKTTWLDSLTFMARRYRSNPRVVGVDILSGPALQEKTRTVPWWGLPDVLATAAQVLGFRLADWRAAASEGAVAVWRGNPDALVVLQGGLYGTDLRYVVKRPLSLAQECLSTRVVFATQECRASSGLFGALSSLAAMTNPFGIFDGLEAVVDKAPGGAVEGSYEDYKRAREEAAYYLASDNKAPVWVGELGTSEESNDEWWRYTLRSLGDSDTSWFYSPLTGSIVADGLFDDLQGAYSAVVGWKLQDLAGLQRPSPLHPERLPGPAPCSFVEAPNAAAARRGTTLAELLATTSWSTSAIAAAVAVLLLPLACCLCCRLLCSGARGRWPKPSWLVPSATRDLEGDMGLERPPKAERRSLWCCTCQRELPVQVPAGVAALLPEKALAPSRYSLIQR